jgi:hypothetical protein
LHRNCLLKHGTEEKVEDTGSWGRWCMQLLDDVTEKRKQWTLKEGALDCILEKTHFGRGHGPVTRETT